MGVVGKLFEFAPFLVPVGQGMLRSRYAEHAALDAAALSATRWGIPASRWGRKIAGDSSFINPRQWIGGALDDWGKNPVFGAHESAAISKGISAFRAEKTWAGGLSAFRKAAPLGVVASRALGVLGAVSRAYWVGSTVAEFGSGVAHGIAYLGKDRSMPNFGTPFMDTQQAYTTRQAGIAAIHNSQLNTRSFFGREASAFH